MTSSPAGVDCGSDCSETYDSGQVVTLTPLAGANYVFDHWSGDCTGSGPCQVTMDADRSVTAVFTLITHNLTVTVTGDEGSVTDNLGGINCTQSGGDCFESYAIGTMVTLTENPTSAWPFTSWGDDCATSSSNTTCPLTMNADHSVSASFHAT